MQDSCNYCLRVLILQFYEYVDNICPYMHFRFKRISFIGASNESTHNFILVAELSFLLISFVNYANNSFDDLLQYSAETLFCILAFIK